MWTPEEIRAAEYVRDNEAWKVADPYGYERQDVGNQHFEDEAKGLATAILKHRPDYDSNCEPLPVDEAFCLSLGMRPGGNGLHCVVELPSGFTLAVWLDGDVFLDSMIFLKNANRPQLRSLLAALGGGT